MEIYIAELRSKLSREVALSISNQIDRLPPARFGTRRLHLPCIVFSVRKLDIHGRRSDNEKVYHAKVSGLGDVEFTTTDDLTPGKQKTLVFAHPWIRYIRGPSIVSSHLGTAVPRVGGYTRALQIIARLGQPFNALLLVQQPNGEYKRIAAENEIVVPGLGTNITRKNIRAQVLEIL
ncbi:hypothetical protein PISMIDRAFT_122776 [Pisolithus microcarpus 441]|uniref:Uncharacterized protein n=1 Tax=Pisolithus microcarpus 441 TaxID=765257 RepID=A0A0C9XGG3_9AGAM|nr:hypothetical protein PISMIDRAFT_122776 [Pisolithus microcarpus 441]